MAAEPDLNPGRGYRVLFAQAGWDGQTRNGSQAAVTGRERAAAFRACVAATGGPIDAMVHPGAITRSGSPRRAVLDGIVAIIDRLSGASRIGLGLAAVGRPGYINLGRAADLPAERTVEAMRARAHDLLDRAYAAGVRYFDVARSYGRAEEFLARWLHARPDVGDVVIGSKWGYTYTAGWRVDAEVHEVKDHGVATFERQLGETRALLGDRLDIYQIHSVTPDSPALTDATLHRRLADLAGQGVTVGLSTSGPGQAEAIRAALGVRVDGKPLFRGVQATWNLLEPSAGPALAAAHDAGCLVIVKEALANGRLAVDGKDDVALAAALHQPWANIVLSGAATAGQLASNLRAESLAIDPARYWRERSQLPWA